MHRFITVAVAGTLSLFVTGALESPPPVRPLNLPSLQAEGSRPGRAPDARTLLKLPAVHAGVILHGLRTERKIALTFDACSTREPSAYDERVTQVLVDTHTPATIFLGGKWILEEEKHARYLASLPQFELANHTYLHPHLTTISDDRIRDELRKTQEELARIAGRPAKLFRPPYGEYDERVVRIAAEMNLTTIEYDLPSGDPAKSVPKSKLIEYVTSMARSGSIVVMHINRHGWHTAEALPEIIRNLRGRGFKLVTVGELLRDLRHK